MTNGVSLSLQARDLLARSGAARGLDLLYCGYPLAVLLLDLFNLFAGVSTPEHRIIKPFGFSGFAGKQLALSCHCRLFICGYARVAHPVYRPLYLIQACAKRIDFFLQRDQFAFGHGKIECTVYNFPQRIERPGYAFDQLVNRIQVSADAGYTPSGARCRRGSPAFCALIFLQRPGRFLNPRHIR